VRRVALLATAALAAAVLSGAAAAGSGVRVVEAKGPPFPVKTFVISLPTGRGLTIHGVHVTENGSAVAEPTLTPASQASPKAFGVVLVSDTSFSMAGKPLAAGLAAEQAFVAQRNPNEQVGVIDFNRKASTALRLTTSSSAISKALSSTPALAGGTHIFDAVHQAESMLSQAHINSGSIVVLSDGADTGSKKTIDEVAQTALRKNMRIYTIGLDDAQFNPGTLQALAAAGHGEYAQAKAGKLAPLFDKLGQTLSNEYLLQYKSLAKPDVPVSVDVSVNGVGSATTPYQTPALAVTRQVAPTYKPSIGNRIWSSTLTMLFIALLAIGAIGLLAYALFQPRRSNLPGRMAEFVSIRELQRGKVPGAPTSTATATATGTATATAGGPATPQPKTPMERFREVLEIAEIDLEPELIILGTILATALAFVFILAITSSMIWAVFALLVPYFVREWVQRTLKRRRDKFAEQLPDALQVIASAMRTGHSFAGALAVVVDSGSEPMKSELRRVVADEQLGVPMEKSLSVVAERMASSDVEQLALVSELQREAGGNAAEVIDRVAETVRERFDLRRMIQTLTTQGRLSRWIVSLLPVFIIVIFELENPHYLHPLVASTVGKILLAFAAAWAALGSYVIKRIVEIEV
jgi:tight adherence protein B